MSVTEKRPSRTVSVCTDPIDDKQRANEIAPTERQFYYLTSRRGFVDKDLDGLTGRNLSRNTSAEGYNLNSRVRVNDNDLDGLQRDIRPESIPQRDINCLLQ